MYLRFVSHCHRGRRCFHASRELRRKATWERHLLAEARSLGVNARRVAPDNLREQLTEAMRKRLQMAGWGSEGTRVQLRRRVRLLELVEHAQRLQMLDSTTPAETWPTLDEVRARVFGHYRSQLRDLRAPADGDITTLAQRVDAWSARQQYHQQQGERTQQQQSGSPRPAAAAAAKQEQRRQPQRQQRKQQQKEQQSE